MNKESINSKTWLDSYEVQTHYHLGKNPLKALRNRGLLGCSKLGKKIYYKRLEIEEVLQKNYILENGKVDSTSA